MVAYDDDTGAVAARAWWLLRWAGVPADRVAVLDGGFRAWAAEGLPVTATPSRPAPGDLVVHPGGMPVVDADAAAELARHGVLLDARAGARYRGETEPVDARARAHPRRAQRAGHRAPRPGRAGGCLRRRSPGTTPHGASLPSAGVRTGRSGGAAVRRCLLRLRASTPTAVVLALEYSGLRPAARPAALYPGSWSQWSADPHRPVATGAEP